MQGRGWIVAAVLLLVVLAAPAGGQAGLVEADRVLNGGDLTRARQLYETCAAEARASGSLPDLARALEGLAAVLLSQGDDAGFRRTLGEATVLRRSMAPQVAPEGELAAGGGFEQGLVPPWGTGHYESGDFSFGIWWNSGQCRSYAKTDGAVTHSGQASLRITNLSPGGPHVFGTTSQRIRAIAPNSLYEISVWARARSASPGTVQFVMDPGWHVRPLSLPGGTWDWKLFRVQFDSGDLSFIDLRLLSLAPGTVWLDGLSLRRLEPGEAAEDPLLTADDLFRRGLPRQALERYRALERQDVARRATVQARMAEALAALGEYGEAMALYMGLRTPTSWRLWLAVGDIYQDLGQPGQALECYEHVHRGTTQDQAMQALAADRMATALLRLDRLREAASYQGEALNIVTHINDPHGRGQGLCHLARIYLRAGQISSARGCLETALPLARATGDRKLESDVLTWRAVVAGQGGDLTRALEDLVEAVRLRRQVFDRYGSIYSLYWLGHYQARAGSRREAVASLTEAVDLLESVRDASGSIARGGETLLRSNAQLYEELVRLLLEEGRSEEALEVLSRSRSDELRRLFQGQAPTLPTERSQAWQEGQALAGDRETLERRLQQELSRPAPEQDAALVEEARRQRERSQAEYREFLRGLFQTHPELAGLISVHPKQLRLKQAALPPGGAIVQYLCGETQLYIFAVTRSALEVRVVDLPRRELTVRMGEWRRLVARGADGRNEDAALMEVSHRLYRDLLGPVEPLLKDVRTLAILPNGPLHYLPFQALVCDPGSGQYLVDRMACVNLCEESFMAPSGGQGPARRILLLGNPDGSLRHAEEEVRGIAALYPGSQAFLGEEARKSLVRTAARDYQGLHIASHGVLDHRDTANSYILLAPDGDRAETGRLTLREIWGLDLDGVDLVTLSACATGLGEGNPGDDLISLENAFMFAGARSVVASLWDVDDAATARLMASFYQNLANRDRVQALQAAQRATKAEVPHPYFWAPFVLIGPTAGGG